ncbi:MAG: helix-turn-helix transcriptional regulator [[Actinobacillus] rossii]|nr:helix-turn-helix transcriptional regulator [[Actinobacillus] rossii]MDY5794096.1 helix-turn-helix transcriptional regulator [[Actinobacillus] rossii]
MNLSSLFSVRLKNERIRLGLTQAEIASKCGISREMWGKYERGVALAGSEVLFSLASLGVDIGYLFSGVQSTPESTLTQKEQTLLEDYRESNEQGKEAIEKTASALAEAKALADSKVA